MEIVTVTIYKKTKPILLSGLVGCFGCSFASSGKRRHFQLGKLLTVAVSTTITLTLMKLEHKNLLIFELLKDFARYLFRRKRFRINDGLLAIVKHKNIKLNLIANLSIKLLDSDNIIFGNFLLLAASCYDCVHVCNPSLPDLATII